jgi:hypothetical protein
MNEYRFRSENMENIKSDFLGKIQSDAEYRADAPRVRIIRKSSVVAIAAAAIILSTTLCALAVGFDPISAWQSLFEKEAAIEVGETVTSAGISMNVQSLYTDGDHAILKMILRDLDGDRLSKEIIIGSIDESKYTAYLLDSSYDSETGEATCIINITLREKVLAGDTLAFTINSIIVNLDYSDEYHPFDYDLYEAAMASKLRPVVSADEWATSAKSNPVPVIADPDYAARVGGVKFNTVTKEYNSMNWLPLDTSVQGVKLINWLSVLGVGFENGILHVQLRYDDLFGYKYQYIGRNPALIDDEGNIIEANSEEDGDWNLSGEILYCGYTELRFDVGDIDNLKNLKLAWTGKYAEHVIDGDWSVDISLDTIGDSFFGSVELQDHPDFTSVSFKLSSMYLETEIRFPDYSLDKTETFYIDGREITSYGFDEEKIKEKVYEKKLAIILKDGTRIEPAFDRVNFNYGGNASNGWTVITSWHLLNGSFDIEDVKEVIIFGVSFTP